MSALLGPADSVEAENRGPGGVLAQPLAPQKSQRIQVEVLYVAADGSASVKLEGGALPPPWTYIVRVADVGKSSPDVTRDLCRNLSWFVLATGLPIHL